MQKKITKGRPQKNAESLPCLLFYRSYVADTGEMQSAIAGKHERAGGNISVIKKV